MQEGTGGVKRSQAENEENRHNIKWRKREGIKEGAGRVKRGHTELEKNLHHDKWRKQEGIKRGLRDIPCVPYEEYEASWDQEIQAKKCRGLINCILYRCGCMERSVVNLAGTVRISPLTPVMRDQQAGMIPALPVQPERASTAAVQNNLISPATSQSTRNTRRHHRSWSSSLFGTGLMLSITATEGFKDWSEITHQMYTPDCNLQPQMPIYMMSGKELFPSHKMKRNLTRNQGVCNIREGDVHKVRNTNLAGVCLNGKLSMLEVLHHQSNMMSGKELFPSHEMECNLTRNQGVCNIKDGDVHKVGDTNLAGVCLKGKLSMLEVLHHQSNVRGPRAKCAHQD